MHADLSICRQDRPVSWWEHVCKFHVCLDTGLRRCDVEFRQLAPTSIDVIPAEAGIQIHLPDAVQYLSKPE